MTNPTGIRITFVIDERLFLVETPHLDRYVYVNRHFMYGSR